MFFIVYEIFFVRSEIKIHEKEMEGQDVTKDKAKFKKKHMDYDKAVSKIYVTVWDFIPFEEYIDGKVGMCSFVAINGKLLSSNFLLKERTFPGRTGPSSVVSTFQHNDLLEFSKIIVEKILIIMK